MAQKYRKKPVVIEAMELHGDLEGFQAVQAWAGAAAVYTTAPGQSNPVPHYLTIHTLEGDHRADIGDFIIKGIKGEFYPCKPDIFEKTYERVEG